MNYRALTQIEIDQLKAQHCQAESWQNVLVVADFKPATIWHVYFSGQVKLASFAKVYELADGCKKHAGIYHAHIHNSVIGKDVYIAHVKNRIANYSIADNVYIEAIDCLITEGESAFGNGTKVAVLDETGSRELFIYDGLTAQIAYLQTIYKANVDSTLAFQSLLSTFCEAQKSTQACVAEHAEIINCGSIKNTRVGAFAKLNGVSLLNNITIASSQKAPTQVGADVIARDSILATGSYLADGAQIERCFVGQGSQISKQFSAVDSVFFANCQGFHGEAVSVFAGPYTVTHHKSTLLIGGLFSFFNAGSASNQSNHMYKLGPIHYGVVDRGSKMASDSYMPWPSRVGSFSVIMGKHKNKLDAAALPFSYLVADGNETIIIPAINLQSIGTFRDADKWQARDLRRDDNLLDAIEFRLFNPYVVSQIYAGIKLLQSAAKNSQSPYFASDFFSDKINIKPSSVQRGIDLYQMALHLYLGDALMARMQANLPMELSANVSMQKWVDLAGCVVPLQAVSALMEALDAGEIKSLDVLSARLKAIDTRQSEWEFVSNLIQAEFSTLDIPAILKLWIEAKRNLEKLLLADAEKEFAANMQTCFGLDQLEVVKQQEFAILRGEAATHAFVQKLQKDTAIAVAKAEAYL